MPIERGLLLKGLGVCAICAGGTAVALKWKDINSAFSTEKRISVAGLECEDQEGGDCRIKEEKGGGKILVKKEESGNHFEVTNLGEGKIKVYRVKGGGEKPKKDVFKFVIEEADIASGDTNKLEEFETYEVKKGEEGAVAELKGKEYLFLKTKAKEGIKKALGLPWDLPDSDPVEHQNINTTSLKDIKFKGGNASISGGTVTLTISKDSSKDSYPFGYKFTFKNTGTEDVTLSYGSKKVIIKKGIDVDFGIRREGMNLFLDSWSLEDLAEKVGLKKVGNDWTIKDEGLNIKQGDEKKYEKLKKATGGYKNGKIKVYDGQSDYYQGFKFSIEEGDFTLASGKDGSKSNVTLGEYETYEIKKDQDGNWYLTRVKDSRDAIKTSLGLPCDLPGDNETQKECAGEINTIKFSGGDATITGTPKLTIHKEDLRQHYPLGYRFAFTSGSESGDASIKAGNVTTTLKQEITSDFKIKVGEEGKMTLDPWTPEELIEKVYFKKDGENWTLGEGTMSVKQGEKKTLFIRKKNTSGKIKLQKEVPGYNQGFKFSIEDGNLTFEEEESSITALNKYETYEISVDNSDGQMYFTRKKNAIEIIKEKLGFPQECITSTEECKNLTQDKLKGIKFSGKGDEDTVTIGSGGSVSMKVDRGESSIFPMGHRFTLISNKEITFSGSSPSSIKANTNTEFKIKEEKGGGLTLERAWNADKLGGKIKLTSCGDDGNQKKCSFGAQISVYESEDSYAENAVITTPEKKITYEEDKDGYNQGFKFYVEGEDINITTIKGSTNKPTKISKKESESPTYEIAQKTANKKTSWYLVKKGG